MEPSFEEFAANAEFTFQLSPSVSYPNPSLPSLQSSAPLRKGFVEGSVEVDFPKEDRHSLDAFFMKITSEEKAEADKLEFEELALEQEKNQANVEKDKREKLLDKREKGKQRQRAYRDRERAKKIAMGETSERKVSRVDAVTNKLA